MTDEQHAKHYRLAQTRRLLRYLREMGIDPREPHEGRPPIDLAPILDAQGRIVPEAEDFDLPSG